MVASVKILCKILDFNREKSNDSLDWFYSVEPNWYQEYTVWDFGVRCG